MWLCPTFFFPDPGCGPPGPQAFFSALPGSLQACAGVSSVGAPHMHTPRPGACCPGDAEGAMLPDDAAGGPFPHRRPSRSCSHVGFANQR